MDVRTADRNDLVGVMNILNGALLAIDAPTVRDRIETEDVLVAREADRLLGVLVLDGTTVEAVAVRPRRRGRGIGTALVTAAYHRRGQLTAGFREELTPFYERLGFDVEPAHRGDRRMRGVLREPPTDRD